MNRCGHCEGEVSSYSQVCRACGAPNCCQKCCDAYELEASAWLVEWRIDDKETWVQAHASEPPARDQAIRNGGTCTPLYRAKVTWSKQNEAE